MKLMKKVIMVFMALIITMGVFTGCSSKPTLKENSDKISFTDSAGRVVEVPKNISKVAPAGAVAQMYVYSVNPEKLAGWANSPSKGAQKYIDKKYWNLPAFGQMYGKNAKLNVEELIKAKPDVVIDLGEKKKGIKEDMDKIQEQIGIPVIFIEATMETMDDAYKTLGKLLNENEQCSKLAKYTEDTVNEAKKNATSIKNKKTIYFGEGESGLETNPRGSVHADVIDLIGAVNVADIKKTKGTGGNQVTIEQILLWNPNVILFGPKGYYANVYCDNTWDKLQAVKNNKVYEVPMGPYNFMGRPPSINRIIGIKWLGNLIYPEVYKYDMVKEVQDFYKLFYHYDLSIDDAKSLLKNSTLK